MKFMFQNEKARMFNYFKLPENEKFLNCECKTKKIWNDKFVKIQLCEIKYLCKY